MTLERISFKKGREHKPRLSKPRIPGRHAETYWSDEENKVLREYYPQYGAAWCTSKLPGRSKAAVYGQARKLGLHCDGYKAAKYRTKEEYQALDAKIAELWPTLEVPAGSVSGVKEIAKQLGEPHWLITQRCRRLGLTRPRKKEPAWSAAEEELMKHVPLHDPDRCSDIFKAHGFNRTATAIVVKSKRLGLKRRYRETFSATSAGKIIGLDAKTVAGYCIKGLIKASRHATKRLPQQGGDPHSIERADLRRFVIENLEMIDFRRVDKFALVDLLIEMPPSAAG